ASLHTSLSSVRSPAREQEQWSGRRTDTMKPWRRKRMRCPLSIYPKSTTGITILVEVFPVTSTHLHVATPGGILVCAVLNHYRCDWLLILGGQSAATGSQ